MVTTKNTTRFLPSGAANELEEATKAVAADVASGRPGVSIVRAPSGFAMLCGASSARVRQVDGGVMIAFAFTPLQLHYMRQRITELLGE